MKKCNKCREEFPATKEYFYAKKDTKDGIQGICKKCEAEHKRQYHKANKKEIAELQKKYRDANKEKESKRGKKYRDANKEKVAKRIKEYAKINKKKIAEYGKEYRKDNKDKISERGKRYRINNKDKCAINRRKREAIKHQLPSTLTAEQWENIKKHFNDKCAYCGKELPLAQEHFLALSKGGEYTANNIIPACQSCNSSKRDNSFFIWYPKFKHYSKSREKKIFEYLNYNKITKIQQLALY